MKRLVQGMLSLIVAPEGYWGETEYDPSDRTNVPAFDPRKDHVGPLTLGASVEREVSILVGEDKFLCMEY